MQSGNNELGYSEVPRFRLLPNGDVARLARVDSRWISKISSRILQGSFTQDSQTEQPENFVEIALDKEKPFHVFYFGVLFNGFSTIKLVGEINFWLGGTKVLTLPGCHGATFAGEVDTVVEMINQDSGILPQAMKISKRVQSGSDVTLTVNPQIIQCTADRINWSYKRATFVSSVYGSEEARIYLGCRSTNYLS
jgi:hypothetical protein